MTFGQIGPCDQRDFFFITARSLGAINSGKNDAGTTASDRVGNSCAALSQSHPRWPTAGIHAVRKPPNDEALGMLSNKRHGNS
jgi:hypothetical protein